MRKLFGTDGIRGTANTEPMTAEIALRVGMAAGAHFLDGDHRHKVVIGKDTRLSGYMVEPALTAGFISVGMDVVLVGPMPTPAVAMLTRSMRADLGVMISASHNHSTIMESSCLIKSALSFLTKWKWKLRGVFPGQSVRILPGLIS
jgi:phosphoglucosamine mutase